MLKNWIVINFQKATDFPKRQTFAAPWSLNMWYSSNYSGKLCITTYANGWLKYDRIYFNILRLHFGMDISKGTHWQVEYDKHYVCSWRHCYDCSATIHFQKRLSIIFTRWDGLIFRYWSNLLCCFPPAKLNGTIKIPKRYIVTNISLHFFNAVITVYIF